MKRSILAVTLAAGLVPVSCSQTDVAAPEYVVGIKFDQPGLSVMDNGKPRGFDVEIANYIAGHLGTEPGEITWVEAPTSKREELLRGGDVDFVVGSYSITAERLRQVAFAGPYFIAGQDLLVREDETTIDRPEDLGGRTVCTVTGSTSADKIKRDFAATANLITRETYSSCVDDLLADRVDAVTADDVVLAGYAAQSPAELRVVGHPFTRERYGVGVRKGDTELQSKITTAIRAMIADGAWDRAIQTHIAPSGYTPHPAPPVFTATDAQILPADPATLDPALVQTVHQLTEAANTQQWETFDSMICPEASPAVSSFVMQYTPKYDDHLGPEVKDSDFQHTTTGIAQHTPDSATFLARETFTNIPAKYRQYFKDIDYTATMTRRDGQWQMCGLAADFVES
ncbi:glutamate ABC transporter substrate-binding protein [Nocardia sp. XZ_19_385]|uniref:glutamate ABC transporter substrate-binding protein n=1 Tax=Nocardia sp. XZ_19_385 TaxID=2769488 RepID=UPI00272E316F|nr:glutamate ABC transporter substrate-binding protein [Nocardia sp. XZ_19_385]